MSPRSEPKRILRNLRLRGALEGMTTRKIVAQPWRQQKGKTFSKKRRSGRAENEPEEFAVEEEDGSSNDPGDDGSEARVGEFPHSGSAAGELDEGDHREGQLKAENDLAENEQRGDFILAGYADDERGGDDGNGAGDEAAEPGFQANVEKAFHHNLAGKGAGEGGVLARGQQGAGEERAGEAHSEDGTEELVGIRDFGNVVKATGVKSGGTENKDGGIDKEREAEGECGIEDGVTNGFASIARRGAERASLDDAGVKIEIVRQHRGAQDADRNVKHFAVPQDFSAGDKAYGGFAPERMSEENFVGEAGSDRGNERDDKGFDQAEAPAL